MNISLKIAAVILAAIAMLGAQPATVAAASFVNSGRPGVVQIPGTYGFKDYYAAYVGFERRTATRSPAYSGTQKISITYDVFRWTGYGWRAQHQKTLSVSAAAGSYITFQSYWTSVPMDGSYTVRVTNVWQTSGGTYLGHTVVDYVAAADYGLGNPCYSCTTGTVSGRGAITFYLLSAHG